MQPRIPMSPSSSASRNCGMTVCVKGINDYIFEKYHSVPEFLWPNIPSYAAFRRSGSKKWFAVIGSVPHGKRVKTFHASDACIDCLSCVQLCPEAAIDIGNITKKRERFPNKKITPAELSEKVIHIG